MSPADPSSITNQTCTCSPNWVYKPENSFGMWDRLRTFHVPETGASACFDISQQQRGEAGGEIRLIQNASDMGLDGRLTWLHPDVL